MIRDRLEVISRQLDIEEGDYDRGLQEVNIVGERFKSGLSREMIPYEQE